MGLHCSHSLTPIIQSTAATDCLFFLSSRPSLSSQSHLRSHFSILYILGIYQCCPIPFYSLLVYSTLFNFGSRSNLVFYCGSEAADVSNSLYFGAGQQDHFLLPFSLGESKGGWNSPNSQSLWPVLSSSTHGALEPMIFIEGDATWLSCGDLAYGSDFLSLQFLVYQPSQLKIGDGRLGVSSQ